MEDVITTGKSSMECVKLIVKSKAKQKTYPLKEQVLLDLDL